MKILFVIGNYGTNQLLYLQALLKESGWWRTNVDVIINTDVPLNIGVKENIVSCPPLEILLTTKQTIFENRGYDLYIFSENDILITWRNIESWLKCRKEVGLPYIIGFLRYERAEQRWYPDIHQGYEWKEPFKIGEYTLRHYTNLHQGCYVLDNELLDYVIAHPHPNPWIGGNHPSGTPNTEQHYGILERANTDIFNTPGLIKVIPVSHLEDFSVWHMPNKYINIIGSEND